MEAVAIRTAPPKTLTLVQWARETFGENGPKSLVTLRRWARNGQIIPRPQKVGREYLVKPGARYVNPNDFAGSLADRI